MKHVRPISLAVIAVIGVATIATVFAQDEPPPTPTALAYTAGVDVRVWQSVMDDSSLYISARPEGGSWQTLGTIPLDMTGLNSRETYRYGDITVGVELPGIAPPPSTTTPTAIDSGEPAPPPDPTPEPEPVTVNVEVRVWQSTANSRSLYISARQEDGDWGALGTVPVDMSGLNSRGTFRYADIAIEVEVVVPWEDVITGGQPDEDSSPWVDPRPDNTYTLRGLAGMSPPAAPTPPPLPDHILALRLYANSLNDIFVSLAHSRDVVATFDHIYDSRRFQVTCANSESTSAGRSRCEYTTQGPFNAAGTERLGLFLASSYGNDFGSSSDLVSVSLRGAPLTCEQKPWSGRGTGRIWWCYDSGVYEAWEEARDRALEPATDPLERWQRQEGQAPIWYQDSPYSGEGDYTTGVTRIEPYVTYRVTTTHTGETEPLLYAFCVPVSPRDGSFVIHTEDQPAGSVPSEFYLRGTYLCEWELVVDGEWTLTVAPVE